MPRPIGVPSWVYPGTRVVGRPAGHVWLIESLQYRGAEGYHVFLKPESRGIPGWFPAEAIARSYYPLGNSSTFPQVMAIELLDLVYRGAVNVTLLQGRGFTTGDVNVHNTTEEPIELSEVVLLARVDTRVHCPGWDGTYVQLEDRQMMVALDGRPPIPYTVRRVQVEEGVRIVLEADPFAEEPDVEPEPDVATLVAEAQRAEVEHPEDAEVWDAIAEVCRPLLAPAPSVRRISVWERIAALRNEKGPDAIPGGAGTGRQAHTFTTTDGGDGVT